jgi:hypothetical protein
MAKDGLWVVNKKRQVVYAVKTCSTPTASPPLKSRPIGEISKISGSPSALF